MPTVKLSRSLLAFWNGASRVDVRAATLAEAVAALDAAHAGLAARILDEQGQLRPHVLVFVNARAVAGVDPARVPLAAGDVVHVLPAVSGG